jgi:hypothetical protein
MGKIKLSIASPDEETLVAIRLIEILMDKNKLNFNLNILFDYTLKEYGVYYLSDELKNNIYVNPAHCFADTYEDKKTIHSHGYLKDVSLFGIIIHEFCHFLQYVVFKDIIEDYIKEFPTERFYINDYANNEFIDEVAEVMTVYITNPYLLKLVSEKHWRFMKNTFKSPVPCTLKSCFIKYNCFPINVKEELKSRWGITFNMDSGCFEKTKKEIV